MKIFNKVICKLALKGIATIGKDLVCNSKMSNEAKQFWCGAIGTADFACDVYDTIKIAKENSQLLQLQRQVLC